MLTRIVLLALICAVAAPAHAELRYTTRIQTRRVESTAPADPLLTLLGNFLAARIPAGEVVTTLGPSAMRVEVPADMGTFPAGSVLLVTDSGMTVLTPSDQTYWTAPAPSGGGNTAQLASQVSVTRSGEFESIAGRQAERLGFNVNVDLPIPAGIALPPSIPQKLVIEGDMWVIDQFKEYGARLAGMINTFASGLGAAALTTEGFVVRQVTRNALLGYEVELTVSDIQEIPAADELFRVPAGYREVSRPVPQR